MNIQKISLVIRIYYNGLYIRDCIIIMTNKKYVGRGSLYGVRGIAPSGPLPRFPRAFLFSSTAAAPVTNMIMWKRAPKLSFIPVAVLILDIRTNFCLWGHLNTFFLFKRAITRPAIHL